MYFELFLQVIGVAQVINKRGFLDHTFTREDEKVFKKTGLILLFIKINEKFSEFGFKLRKLYDVS